MNAVFRPGKWHRNIALAGFLLFVVVGGALVLLDMHTQDEIDFDSALLWLVAVCGGPLWMLLVCWRYRVTIHEGRVCQQDVFSSKAVELDEITKAQWFAQGSLLIKAGDKEVRVNFHNIEQNKILELIRYFRNELPHSLQHDWPLFCYRFALPIRDPPANNRELQEDEVLITRNRWDWYFLPTIVLSIGIGVAFWFTPGAFHFWFAPFLFAPLLLAPLWLLARCMTSKQGEVYKRLSPGLWKRRATPDLIDRANRAAEEWERQESMNL